MKCEYCETELGLDPSLATLVEGEPDVVCTTCNGVNFFYLDMRCRSCGRLWKQSRPSERGCPSCFRADCEIVQGTKYVKVYYSHPTCTYGTDAERKAIKAIEQKWHNAIVINPRSFNFGDGERFAPSLWHNVLDSTLPKNMSKYLELVRDSDVLVFSRLLGQITVGVGIEVNEAIHEGKQVFEATANGIVSANGPVIPLSYSDTIESMNAYQAALRESSKK